MKNSYQAGAAARPELTAAQLALNKVQLDLASEQSKLAESRSKLAEAVGVSLEALNGIDIEGSMDSDTSSALDRSQQLSTAEARHAALCGRADILAALAAYAVAEDNLNLEIAKQYPDVHFNPSYQYDQGDNKWTFGFSVELPILNQNQGPIAEAKANRELAAARFLQLQAQIAAQVDRAVSGWQGAQAQLKTSSDILENAKRQQHSVVAQAHAGAAARPDLAAAQIEFTTVRLARLDSQVQAQAALGTLEDALQQPCDNFDVLKILSSASDKKSQQ
jgi:outer membrane protein TolC